MASRPSSPANRARSGSCSRTVAERSTAPDDERYGGLATTRSKGRGFVPESQSLARMSRRGSTPWRRAFSRVSARASMDASRATARDWGFSSSHVIAMIPQPVPASRIRRASGDSRRASGDDDFGLRARDERPLVHPERPSVEIPLPEQVLDRRAVQPLRPELAESGRLGGGEIAVRVDGERIGMLQDVREKDAGVPGRGLRADVSGESGRVFEQLPGGHGQTGRQGEGGTGGARVRPVSRLPVTPSFITPAPALPSASRPGSGRTAARPARRDFRRGRPSSGAS